MDLALELQRELVSAGLGRLPADTANPLPPVFVQMDDGAPSPQDRNVATTLHVSFTRMVSVPDSGMKAGLEHPVYDIDVRSVEAAEAIDVANAIARHFNPLQTQGGRIGDANIVYAAPEGPTWVHQGKLAGSWFMVVRVDVVWRPADNA